MAAKSERLTVYARIHKDIREQIFSGALRPGDMLPSENQLCGEYAASRETVRKGLKALEQEGLIFSRPKVGYFVSRPNHSDLTITLTEERKDHTTQYRDIHGIHPDEDLQKILGIDAGQKVIELSQVTCNPRGDIVSLDVKFVPYERAYPSVESEMRYAVLPDLTLDKVASFEFYTDVHISAVSADEKVAAAMECPLGEPLLLIEKAFILQDGKCIGYVRQYSRSSYGRLHGTSGVHF